MRKKIMFGMIFLLLCILCTACGKKEAGKKQEDEKKQEDMRQYPLTSQLEIPSRKELKEIYPESYNKELMKKKGLSETEDFSEKYLYMQALYRANLETYLMDTLDLQELDNTLANDEIHYFPIEEAEKDVYARYSTMNLRYIYLRNNLCIERLEKEDLDTIEKALKEGNEVVTEEMKALAARTYSIVIPVVDESETEEDIRMLEVSYLGGCSEPNVPNKALVLVIGTSYPYDEDGWEIQDFPRIDYYQTIAGIKKEKEESYKNILDTSVYILKETKTCHLSNEEIEEIYGCYTKEYRKKQEEPSE